MSEPQMPAARTSISTSLGPTSGTGTSRSSTSPLALPYLTSAFILGLLPAMPECHRARTICQNAPYFLYVSLIEMPLRSSLRMPLSRGELLRLHEDLHDQTLGDDHHPVDIAKDEISRMDERLSDADGDLVFLDIPSAYGAGRAFEPGKDGKSHLVDEIEVTDSPVDDRPPATPLPSGRRHDLSPMSGLLVTTACPDGDR